MGFAEFRESPAIPQFPQLRCGTEIGDLGIADTTARNDPEIGTDERPLEGHRAKIIGRIGTEFLRRVPTCDLYALGTADLPETVRFFIR